MGQIFHTESDDFVAFSNRPSLLPELLGFTPAPQARGWSLYLGSGQFADDSSPVQHVRLLEPGERLTGQRVDEQGWRFRTERRLSLDDLVRYSVNEQPGADEVARWVEGGIRRVVRDLAEYWPEPLTMGLSGGKDSRLLAAALVSEGIVPRFVTNEENPREGETARQLSRLLAQHRGVRADHHFYVATEPDRVHKHSVAERAHQLHQAHDFLFRSTYVNRPVEPVAERRFPAPSLVGICGEYLSDYWLPEEWKANPAEATADEALSSLRRHLTSAAPRKLLTPAALAHLDLMIEDRFARARENGLDPFGTVSYGYMTGRIRRAATPLTNPHQIIPLAVPETIRAAFALSPREKAERSLHNTVINRLVPEWAAVPFVGARTGVRDEEIFRIWHGSGMNELRELISDSGGPITQLLELDRVKRALKRAEKGTGTGRDDATLRQFAMAAVADTEFERRQLTQPGSLGLVRSVQRIFGRN